VKIVVVGSGLIGVCTAYFLRRHGHDVTVVDRQEGPGRETSFANGALLTPSMSDPWNTPGCWRVLLGSLLRSDAPLQLRLGALPTLAGWGVDFLRNSNAQRFERSRRTNFHLARYSLDVMQSLQKDANLEYGLSARGALRVFRDPAAMAGAVADAARMEPLGMKFRRLSPAETIEMEPALAPIAEQLAGAVHYLTDATGDAHRFCVALAAHARDLGVEFRFNTEISSLQVRSGAVTALSSAR
jgi:D-amino-acid dehydrogenase